MNIKKEIITLGLLLASILHLPAQQEAYPTFSPPFDFPLVLSGGFGELRSNHFHGGIDFKTQGVVGKPIRNIAAGYISRAVVTPGGYGQALYVTHPSGYTSIHGHLLKFSTPIQQRVEEQQYADERFAVDVRFEPDEFWYEAGEIIALSGNEGYSFGPHLHMEIRETDTWAMIDPLQFYKHLIKDTTPPRASFVMLYPQAGRGVVEASAAKKRIPVPQLGTPIEVWGDVAIGIKAFDYMDGTTNHYGVRKVTLFVDNQERFRSTIDKVYPAENRMINAWTDYEEHRTKGKWVMRSHLLPGTNLHQLETDASQGILTIDQERTYAVRYELEDLHGNRATYSFQLLGKPQPITVASTAGSPNELPNQTLLQQQGNVVHQAGMHVEIPRGSLYHDVALQSQVWLETDATPRIYQLHDTPVPLHIPCSLQIRVPVGLDVDASQYYIAQVRGKRTSSVGGTYEAGWVKTTIRELGSYAVAVDTIPPRITPLNQKQWAGGHIQFRVKDDETGIQAYKAYVDGEFVLFGYDLKSHRLILKHPNRLKPGRNRKLELWVTDRCGNEVTMEYLF